MNPDQKTIRQLLQASRHIAVLGAHRDEQKAAHYVPRYLHSMNYTLYPVNPKYAGEVLFGRTVLAGLAELETQIDIVNVFRRSEQLAGHVADILAMQALPRLVWCQLGIRDDVVAERLTEAGITVVQDRCILVDHQRLL